MFLNLFSRLALILSGLTALFVGLSIVLDPVSFYAGYGIELANSPGLVNELKAPAGGIVFTGVLALLGTVWSRLTRVATGLSALFYLSYGLSRTLSLALDGIPGPETLLALGVELGLGVLCLGSLWAQGDSLLGLGRSRR